MNKTKECERILLSKLASIGEKYNCKFVADDLEVSADYTIEEENNVKLKVSAMYDESVKQATAFYYYSYNGTICCKKTLPNLIKLGRMVGSWTKGNSPAWKYEGEADKAYANVARDVERIIKSKKGAIDYVKNREREKELAQAKIDRLVTLHCGKAKELKQKIVDLICSHDRATCGCDSFTKQKEDGAEYIANYLIENDGKFHSMQLHAEHSDIAGSRLYFTAEKDDDMFKMDDLPAEFIENLKKLNEEMKLCGNDIDKQASLAMSMFSDIEKTGLFKK